MTTGRDKSSLPERDHSREARAQAMLGQTANDQGKTVAIYITLCPACSRAHPGGPHSAPDDKPRPARPKQRPLPTPLHPGWREDCGAVRRACAGMRRPDRQGAVGGRELRTPYLHQLPPVLPKNSFFSEFQMNFFQLPSSLAFPRAMVAGQRLPRGLRVGECGARPRVLPGCWLAAPARFSAGCTSRYRCGSPSARRAPEGQRQEPEEGEAAAGAEGGAARAGRLRAPHLLVGARPLADALWSATGSSGPLGVWGLGEDAAAAPAATGAACSAPASCDLCRGRQGAGESRREGRTSGLRTGPRGTASSREIGSERTPYLYYIPRRGGLGPRPLAARLANRGRGGGGA